MCASYIFTSESVSEGHPDKVADQISDAVVDLLLATDPEARVACETMVTTQKIILSGEIRSSDRALIDEHGVLTQEGRDRIEQAARETVKRIGYEQTGFHWKTARSEEHTSELQSLMSISYDVFCLNKNKQTICDQLTKIEREK